jgi:hypothetical protein
VVEAGTEGMVDAFDVPIRDGTAQAEMRFGVRPCLSLLGCRGRSVDNLAFYFA